MKVCNIVLVISKVPLWIDLWIDHYAFLPLQLKGIADDKIIILSSPLIAQ